MATLTKQQYSKWNSQAPQGWKLDAEHYVIWSEKQLTKTIMMPDGTALVATICHRENYKKECNSYGVHYTRPAGTYHTELHVSHFRRCEGSTCWISHGTGAWQALDAGEYARKNYKDLCKMAATVTDDAILKLQPEM